jgi:predicted anti-sigma-YlaC factor YlaD
MMNDEVPEPSPDFETRILEGIDESERRNRSLKFRKYVISFLSTAAVIFIVVASWFFLTQNREPRDTFTDPELAYAETMKILIGVSYQLNQGERALAPVKKMNELTIRSVESINKSTRIVGKNLKNLDYLKKVIEITNNPVEKNINK